MRNRMLGKISTPLLAIALMLACPVHAGIQMARVAAFPGGLSGTLPCGNICHDAHVELVGSVGNGMEVIEDTGWNEYRVQHINFPPGGYLLAMGDGNGNGLSELITVSDSLCIWEQVAPESFPSRLVFRDTTMEYWADRAEFCDLDKDGHADILADYGPTLLWENRGGDRYEPVPFPTQSWWPGSVIAGAIGDFDGDGLMEIGGGSGWGGLVFFECCGDDRYVPTCTMPPPPGQSWDPPCCCTAARNMEGDGLSEFVSMQNGYNEQQGLILVRIIKEPVHNQFVEVCTLNFNMGESWGCLAAGDVNGDARDELAISTGIDVRLLEYVGPGQYVQECLLNKNEVKAMRMFDLNQDGRSELSFAVDSTFIYEDTSGLLGITEFSPHPKGSPVKVAPSVVRLGASLRFSDIPPGADIEVLSLDGRLVCRTSGVRQSSWTWNLRNQSGSLVPAGTYFAVIRSKGKATSLKLCIVK